MQEEIRAQADYYYSLSKRIDTIYANYAKSVGNTYTSLYVLSEVVYKGSCTQKELCEELFLPKQTINSIVMGFCRQGFFEMSALAEDRRHKAIRLTEKGRAYADEVLPAVEQAEMQGIAQFSAKERAQLLTLTERYATAFEEALMKKSIANRAKVYI